MAATIAFIDGPLEGQSAPMPDNATFAAAAGGGGSGTAVVAVLDDAPSSAGDKPGAQFLLYQNDKGFGFEFVKRGTLNEVRQPRAEFAAWCKERGKTPGARQIAAFTAVKRGSQITSLAAYDADTDF